MPDIKQLLLGAGAAPVPGSPLLAVPGTDALRDAAWLHAALAQLVSGCLPDGFPACHPQDAARALAGVSQIDTNFWEGLNGHSHFFAVEHGELIGACALAHSVTTVQLPWLYAADDNYSLARVLLAAAEDWAGGQRIEAFNFATALGFGLEGLPARCQPSTAEAFADAGFEAHDDWACFLLDGLRGDWPGEDVAVAQRTGERVELTVTEDGRTIGECEYELFDDGTVGTVHWLFVEEDARGRGLGRGLFHQALRDLHAQGAERVVLHCDDDDPVERNRDRAKAMYRRAGFVEIDRELNFHKPAR